MKTIIVIVLILLMIIKIFCIWCCMKVASMEDRRLNEGTRKIHKKR